MHYVLRISFSMRSLDKTASCLFVLHVQRCIAVLLQRCGGGFVFFLSSAKILHCCRMSDGFFEKVVTIHFPMLWLLTRMVVVF